MSPFSARRRCEEPQATRQFSGRDLSREHLRGALRAHFMTGLPRFARNDDSSGHLAHGPGGRYFRFAI